MMVTTMMMIIIKVHLDYDINLKIKRILRSYRFKSQEVEYVHFFTLMKCTWNIKCIFCYSIQKSARLSYINLVYNLIIFFLLEKLVT